MPLDCSALISPISPVTRCTEPTISCDVADAAADELLGAQFGADALHVRLDRAQHLQQLAVGEVHAAVVGGDAEHGVQVVQRLQYEAVAAQFGLGLGLACGQPRLRAL
ncbi:hypothetical protein [Xanthomonas translucens]|uniref:hypothetical protein n=1 Tax=Xanthomonas campestris pv. translucens TaxID=343 RepID=UPI0006553F2C|nr:hypothetical protein FD63_14440 [Xanthomonas translucens pv. undulosa]MBC3971691.1 hypothetical protein [Xanthomonas translucens pv. undulosa]UKE41815.1 hypothetical protein KCU58_05265 [Xanthomonas translucens pv. undulosa]